MSHARPSVLFVITGLPRGGAQKQMAETALRLARRGYPVRGVLSLAPLTPYARVLQSRGLPVYSVEMRNRFADPGAPLRMRRIVRRLDPDVLITFLFHASILGALGGRAAGVRRIVTSVRSERLGGAHRDWVFRWSRGFWRATVVNSRAVAATLVERKIVGREGLYVIPNGVEASPPPSRGAREMRAGLGIADDTFIWLSVGSLLPAKDYPTLLRAVAALGRPDALLLIAGAGPMRRGLERLAGELRLSGAVRFLGERDDVVELLHTCDAFVSASAWEGMPNAVMEALATGRPVVATEVGGLREVIEHGRTGWLAPAGDALALAAAMSHVMGLNLEERTRTGERGLAAVLENFGWDHVIREWERVIENV